MHNPKKLIAVPVFPGSNGEMDNVRTLHRCGFDTLVFRWNESREKLAQCDGYFFGAGFSYEDRGRSGMVAARDPLFAFLHEESEKGKVIIGNCNGAQVLVESGLIPMGENLRMSLAHNAIQDKSGQWKSPGFLNEWIWMKRTCAKDRCATSDWEGVMHIPIAHGEGRFVTKDRDLLKELEKNDQIAFQYCDKNGCVSEEPGITPNGSTFAIAGLCNPAGNVVAIMPHPERTPKGDAYFLSLHSWLRNMPKKISLKKESAPRTWNRVEKMTRKRSEEIFIKIIITDNEERTVEQAAKRIEPAITIKQYRYIAPTRIPAEKVLSALKYFNPNKERALVRRKGEWLEWNASKKSLVPTERQAAMINGTIVLRKNEPEIYPTEMGEESEVGIVYLCSNIAQNELMKEDLLEVFSNPHSSHLELLHS